MHRSKTHQPDITDQQKSLKRCLIHTEQTESIALHNFRPFQKTPSRCRQPCVSRPLVGMQIREGENKYDRHGNFNRTFEVGSRRYCNTRVWEMVERTLIGERNSWKCWQVVWTWNTQTPNGIWYNSTVSRQAIIETYAHEIFASKTKTAKTEHGIWLDVRGAADLGKYAMKTDFKAGVPAIAGLYGRNFCDVRKWLQCRPNQLQINSHLKSGSNSFVTPSLNYCSWKYDQKSA